MSSETELKTGLFEVMEGITLSNAKIPENIEENYTIGESFVRYFIQPVLKKQASYGTDGPNYHRGIFHIEICSPNNVGPLVPMQIADAICPYFKRGTKVTLSNGEISFDKCEIKTAYRENSLYVLPIYATYRALMSND